VTNRWPGQGSTASLLHPYGTVPGWHGGADARLLHPGAGTGGHPGTTFAAGATVATGAAAAGAAGFHVGVAPHWHEFMRGSAPAFDAAGSVTFAHAHEHDFHVNDVRFFTAHELEIWRHGIWHDGWHNGHWGWWWAVGDVWYPYPAPIYPYPVVVAPLVIEDQIVVPGVPPGAPPPQAAMVGAPPPSALSSEIPPLPAPPQVTYQCNNPQGAFPDVGACSDEWTATPLSTTAMSQ